MSETEERQARDAVVRVSHALYMRGLSPGTTGNISIRLSDGRLVVTPTNSSLGFLAVSDLALVDADGTVAKGSARPSKETALHQVFYERADIGAVVHLHSGWAVALSWPSRYPAWTSCPTPSAGHGTRDPRALAGQRRPDPARPLTGLSKRRDSSIRREGSKELRPAFIDLGLGRCGRPYVNLTRPTAS